MNKLDMKAFESKVEFVVGVIRKLSESARQMGKNERKGCLLVYGDILDFMVECMSSKDLQALLKNRLFAQIFLEAMECMVPQIEQGKLLPSEPRGFLVLVGMIKYHLKEEKSFGTEKPAESGKESWKTSSQKSTPIKEQPKSKEASPSPKIFEKSSKKRNESPKNKGDQRQTPRTKETETKLNKKEEERRELKEEEWEMGKQGNKKETWGELRAKNGENDINCNEDELGKVRNQENEKEEIERESKIEKIECFETRFKRQKNNEKNEKEREEYNGEWDEYNGKREENNGERDAYNGKREEYNGEDLKWKKKDEKMAKRPNQSSHKAQKENGAVYIFEENGQKMTQEVYSNGENGGDGYLNGLKGENTEEPDLGQIHLKSDKKKEAPLTAQRSETPKMVFSIEEPEPKLRKQELIEVNCIEMTRVVSERKWVSLEEFASPFQPSTRVAPIASLFFLAQNGRESDMQPLFRDFKKETQDSPTPSNGLISQKHLRLMNPQEFPLTWTYLLPSRSPKHWFLGSLPLLTLEPNKPDSLNSKTTIHAEITRLMTRLAEDKEDKLTTSCSNIWKRQGLLWAAQETEKLTDLREVSKMATPDEAIPEDLETDKSEEEGEEDKAGLEESSMQSQSSQHNTSKSHQNELDKIPTIQSEDDKSAVSRSASSRVEESEQQLFKPEMSRPTERVIFPTISQPSSKLLERQLVIPSLSFAGMLKRFHSSSLPKKSKDSLVQSLLPLEVLQPELEPEIQLMEIEEELSSMDPNEEVKEEVYIPRSFSSFSSCDTYEEVLEVQPQQVHRTATSESGARFPSHFTSVGSPVKSDFGLTMTMEKFVKGGGLWREENEEQLITYEEVSSDLDDEMIGRRDPN